MVQCSTIHITPEEGFSYASVELSCDAAPDVPTDQLVEHIAAIFQPKGQCTLHTLIVCSYPDVPTDQSAEHIAAIFQPEGHRTPDTLLVPSYPRHVLCFLTTRNPQMA